MLLDVNHPRRRYDVRTAGVLITPHTLASGDIGTVIVAASFVHTDHNIGFAFAIYYCNFSCTHSVGTESVVLYVAAQLILICVMCIRMYIFAS